MKPYEVTLMATACKTLRICADSQRMAEALAERIIRDTDVLCLTREEVDGLAVQATELVEPSGEEMLPARERLLRNLLKFCMEQTAEYDRDEIREMLEGLELDMDFDPLLYWEFDPICSFAVDGSSEFSHIYRHNRLFGQNGFRLDESTGKGTAGMSTISESYELWLLEDMSLTVTFCCQMEVRNGEGDYEIAEYRYPVSGSYAELTGDFSVEDFLESVADQIFTARHMD